MYKLCIMVLVFSLVGCTTNTHMAPVVELRWQPPRTNQNTHVVKRGETLYAIAFRYDQDYRQLARFNHLHRPYSLRVGQVLHVHSSTGHVERQRYLPVKTRAQVRKLPYPQKKSGYKAPKSSYLPQSQRGQSWVWPVKGRVVTHFIPQNGKKGINIAGVKGEKIRAASDGVVAYAGSGLLGYGNLIIIKHNNHFLTAYGNNSRNTVKEGQKVKAGQIIAEIGIIDRSYWGVHFEIRKAGKPVNPLHYLK